MWTPSLEGSALLPQEQIAGQIGFPRRYPFPSLRSDTCLGKVLRRRGAGHRPLAGWDTIHKSDSRVTGLDPSRFPGRA